MVRVRFFGAGKSSLALANGFVNACNRPVKYEKVTVSGLVIPFSPVVTKSFAGLDGLDLSLLTLRRP